MTDYTLADTIHIMFTTRAFATGIPTVLAGSPVVSAYEDASTTQITAGITLGVDHDSVVGLNLLTIVATGANGYGSGQDYNLVITTGTVGGVSVVGEVVGRFTLGRSAAAVDLANGTDGLGAIKTDTAAILTDTADIQPKIGTPVTDLSADIAVIEAQTDDIGVAGAGLTAINLPDQTMNITGNLSGSVGSVTGSVGSVAAAVTIDAGSVDAIWDEVLSGGTHNVSNSSGRRIRELADASILSQDTFQAGSTTTSVVLASADSSVDDFYTHQVIRIIDGVAIDQVRVISDYVGSTRTATITPALVTAAPASGDEYEVLSIGPVHTETLGGGYENGAVFVSSAGSTGTQLYVDGTIDNPIDDGQEPNVRTVVDALNMERVTLLSGASMTLTQTWNNYTFDGVGGAIALASQDIGGTRFVGLALTGVGVGSGIVVARDCILIGVTINGATLIGCNLRSTLTLGAVANYTFNHCISGRDDTIIDFGAAVGNTSAFLNAWSGNLEIQNLGATGTDVLTINGNGTITLNANCTGGTVNVTGNIEIVNNGSGITINENAAVTMPKINTEVDTALSDIGLDHIVSAAVVGADITDDSIVAQLSSSSATADWDTFDNTTDSLQAISDSGGGGPTAAAIADAVWEEAKADHTGTTTFGDIATDLDSVLADTADIQPKIGTPAADVSADIAAVKVDTAATLVDTAEIGTAGAGLTDLGGMSTAMKAEVNVEVVDVLKTDTVTLPGQVTPPLAPTMEEILGHLYKVYRNRKTQTSSQWSLLADDESTVDQKATISDDTVTAIKQEIVAGP